MPASVEKKENSLVSDEELMSRFQSGEHLAFDKLVNRYRERAVSVAFQYLHNLEEAKDTAQDVFVKVFQASGKFKNGEKFAPWFYRILINHTINIYRRKKVVRFFSIFQNEDDSGRSSLADVLVDPQNLEETIDLQNAVREAIRQLPEKLRSVVILREIEGFSEAETTKILKIPSGTVKSRLFHARKKLKKILEKSL